MMPYEQGTIPCKKCGNLGLFRSRWNNTNKKFYLQSTCRSCELAATKKHQKENREYWRALNRKSYLNKVGEFTRRSPLEMTDALRAEYARHKAKLRLSRLRRVAFFDELTELVREEATLLRKLRIKMTGIEWQRDHIIPLSNPQVSGLDIWSNIRVIPRIVNLVKGNSFAQEV